MQKKTKVKKQALCCRVADFLEEAEGLRRIGVLTPKTYALIFQRTTNGIQRVDRKDNKSYSK